MDTYSLTIMQITLIVMIAGVVFWGMATWSERKKLTPQLEQERAMRLQGEIKLDEEVAQAKETLGRKEVELAKLSERVSELERNATSLSARLRSEGEESAQKITQLTTELTTARQQQQEATVQMANAATRINSLEAALEAEKGRIAAMQEALEAKQDLAKQLAQELSSTRHAFADERNAANERENELRTQLAKHEKLAASGQTMADVVNAELEKTRAAQAMLEAESSAKMADLQRKLSAADQRSAMLQKEIMALVSSSGNTAEAAAAVTAAEEIVKAQERARLAEKRVQELESQLSTTDLDTRKRLREAEYKVCELEFKLAESEDAKNKAITASMAAAAAAAKAGAPPSEPAA